MLNVPFPAALVVVCTTLSIYILMWLVLLGHFVPSHVTVNRCHCLTVGKGIFSISSALLHTKAAEILPLVDTPKSINHPDDVSPSVSETATRAFVVVFIFTQNEMAMAEDCVLVREEDAPASTKLVVPLNFNA